MNRKDILIYVAGPYTSSIPEEIDMNIHNALMTSRNLWNMGFTAICPHANTYHFERYAPELTWDDYLERDMVILSRCDAVFMMHNWQLSRGATREWDFAFAKGIPIFDEYADLEMFRWGHGRD